MRHIMVATDGSSGANRAVDLAAELAKAVAGDLLITTVADSELAEEARQLARAEGSLGDVLEALTAQMLRAAEARARHLGVSRIELRTGSGDVAQSLIDIAASNSVEMIVLGRRGRGQLTGCCLAVFPRNLSASLPVQSLLFPKCKIHAPTVDFRVPDGCYPLMQISGRSRATLRASPACSAAATTTPTSL